MNKFINIQNNSSNMQKKRVIKLLTFLVLSMFLINSISALDSLGTYKKGQDVRITQVCSDATYVNISSIAYPNGTVAVSGIEMTSAGSGEYYYDFNDTSAIGQYHVRGISDGCEETFATYFDVTSTGKPQTITFSIVHALLISLLVGSIVGFYFLHNKVNFEKWHNSIINKYEHRNYIKLVLSSIAYNFMKNSFIIYYLLGLIIIVSLQEIVFFYGLDNFISIIKSVLIVYSVGIILVGLLFLGKVQEWFMDLLNNISQNAWGLEE
ncbi:MAG: hypothetical protein ACOC56_02990 [Atribacterota bacterium]